MWIVRLALRRPYTLIVMAFLIAITRANAVLAASRQALITAQELVHQQELAVKTARTRGGLANPPLLAAYIVPTDSLEIPEQGSDPPLEEMVQSAIHNRPNLASAVVQVENSEISLEGSLDALKPQLDLVGTVQNSGLAETLNPLATTSSQTLAPGGYGTALGQVFRPDYPTYAIGIQLALPLRDRVAQAGAIRDELQRRKAQVRRQQLEDQVRLEVADAEENLRQTQAAYDAAVEAERLQEQSVNVEQQTFDVGLSANLQLIQYQTYPAQARSTEVASRGAYIEARIAFERALGKILEDHNGTIEKAYTTLDRRHPNDIRILKSARKIERDFTPRRRNGADVCVPFTQHSTSKLRRGSSIRSHRARRAEVRQ